MYVLHRYRLQGLVATIGGRWLVRMCSGEAPGVGAIATQAYAAVGRASTIEQDRAIAIFFKLVCLHRRAFCGMPIFQGTALAPTNALEVEISFYQASVAAAAASASAAAAEASAMQADADNALTNQSTKTKKRIRRRKPSDGGVNHWSSNLGLNELVWMCPPGSQESFANICLVIQIGKGDLNMRFFLQISNFQVCHTSFQIRTAFMLSFAIRRLAI
jgi:hypothetical protein